MHKILRRIMALNPEPNPNRSNGSHFSITLGKRLFREAYINITIEREEIFIHHILINKSIYIEIPYRQELEFQQYLKLLCA